MADTLRFAMFGAGFWSRFQLHAWLELADVECVAIYNRTRSRGESLATEFGIDAVYDDPEMLLANEPLHFVDIVTAVDTHAPLVSLVAAHRLPVICQKPMASSIEEARVMVEECQRANVPLLVHENWRWQRPIRELRRLTCEGHIGRPFRARIDMITGYDVFRNQPALGQLEHFIIADLGSHLLDTVRFLFGEPESVYCQTAKAHTGISGEDVATLAIAMPGDLAVVCMMAYAGNYVERECFPQTLVFIEGEKGTIELDRDYWVRITTEAGTFSRRYQPTRYAWADPQYEVVHASIVSCQHNLLNSIRGVAEAETTGIDNSRTAAIVCAAYESASTGSVVSVPTTQF